MIEDLQDGAREAVVIMSDSQVESTTSVTIANKAGDHLSNVTTRISGINGMNQSTAAATEEQTAAVEAINGEITEIDSLNQHGAGNLQLTMEACHDLQAQSQGLKALVARFKI
jgi:methyl-accepting chemotaxis protein